MYLLFLGVSRDDNVCQSIDHFGSDRNTSTVTGCITIMFWTDIHGPQRMSTNDIGDPKTLTCSITMTWKCVVQSAISGRLLDGLVQTFMVFGNFPLTFHYSLTELLAGVVLLANCPFFIYLCYFVYFDMSVLLRGLDWGGPKRRTQRLPGLQE